MRAAVGRHSGRAEALTVIMPLQWGGATALAAWLWILRRAPTPLRMWAVGQLDSLRFVSAIRWSLLPPFEQPRGLPPWRSRDQRRQLLFESNFDGDWDDYLEAFGAVMSRALRTIVDVGHGFPGLDDVAQFKAYAKSLDHEPVLYVSAYGDLTAADVYQELAAREGRRARRAARRHGMGRSHPAWATFLLPLRPGRASAAARAARALDAPLTGSDRSLLLSTDLVHYGRIVVVDRPSGSWLLVTLTHDGTAEQVLTDLVAADSADATTTGAPVGTSPLRRLLSCCEGIPEPDVHWSDEQFVAHLLSSRPRASRHHMAYCGHSGRSVLELRTFVDRPTRRRTWPVPEEPA